ncbi:hypothetical protein AOLI_G00312360 [Acnodon oligacanthus]
MVSCSVVNGNPPFTPSGVMDSKITRTAPSSTMRWKNSRNRHRLIAKTSVTSTDERAVRHQRPPCPAEEERRVTAAGEEEEEEEAQTAPPTNPALQTNHQLLPDFLLPHNDSL